MQDLKEYYSLRTQRYAIEERACERKNNRYTWLRLALIVAAIAAAISLFPVAAWLGAATTLALVVCFAIVLKRHLKTVELQQQKERMKIINQQELDCIGGNFSAFAQGSQYQDTKHFYSSDLDIFGSHSLFRYLNRTTSPSGSEKLAAWLSNPAKTEEIQARQQAVTELVNHIGMRQKIQAIGLKNKDIDKELPHFIEWLNADDQLSKKRKLLLFLKIMPWITIAIAVMGIVNIIPSVILLLPASIHFILFGKLFRKISLLHQQVSNKVKFISTYSEMIDILCAAKFKSPYLVSIRECFVSSNALQQIKELQKRIIKLDFRLNYAYVPVNILFFFDYKHLVWLERWRWAEGKKLPEWFEAIAKIEALSSFANMMHNNPTWAMPTITDEYFHLEAKSLGHPLITCKERVCNDFSLTGGGQIAIITGSNMSGKSTFERSIGVNIVLALAGAPVCASKFVVTNCKLYTYMRIADNLEEQTSSFYAELKRLKQLIDIIKDNEKVFFLLDEVLRGTNSNDRQIGSMALIRQLVKQKTSGIIATHDLALGILEEELPQNVGNAHFDVKIDNEDMAFDYKLHKGICTSLNASILMKKIGIEVET